METTDEDLGVTESPPASIRIQHFAVPSREQLAGRMFSTAPHARSPLAQTLSPSAMESEIPISQTEKSTQSINEVANYLKAGDETVLSEGSMALHEHAEAIDVSTSKILRVAKQGSTPETRRKSIEDVEVNPTWSEFLDLYSEGRYDGSRAPPRPQDDSNSQHTAHGESLPVLSEQSTVARPSLQPKHYSEYSFRRKRPASAGRAQSSPAPTASNFSASISQRRSGEQLLLRDFVAPSLVPSSISKDSRSLQSSLIRSPSRPLTPEALADAATLTWAGAHVHGVSSPDKEALNSVHPYPVTTPPRRSSAEYFAHPGTSPSARPRITPVGTSTSPRSVSYEPFSRVTPMLTPVTERSIADWCEIPGTTAFGSSSSLEFIPESEVTASRANTEAPSEQASSSSHVASREQDFVAAEGFLFPPYPPNELERMTALHKFNILHTANDQNFDRIAHLAQLVFKAQRVLISLVDADEQFLKYNSGLSGNTGPRSTSFCGHTILQETEPMVVLDASKDWRFANNPFVTNPPGVDTLGLKIRFYAGTPLRTSDGFNVGSLCIIDDKPRSEFAPRQRHILKEFGAIVMREMELWKDTVGLRLRDRIQTSMEHFTRECLEFDGPTADLDVASPELGMMKVYVNAAQLVKKTLDVEGAVVLNCDHFETLQSVAGHHDSQDPKRYHGDALRGHATSPSPRVTDSDEDVAGGKRLEYGPIDPLIVLGAAESGSIPLTRNERLSGDAHEKLATFLSTYPDGKIYERVVPSCFKGIVPANFQYAMVVPIFGVDGNPFLILSAYTTDRRKHYLEGYELQFLRGVGVIILSAALKRRMKLADKAKSLFISNISHELRTPLHGILAAAELLGESGLTRQQMSYLKTVENCGLSLIETVNHVLDFSKLSGTTSKSVAVKRSAVDLITLLEDIVEGCWVGSRARSVYGNADIGSAYSPPNGASISNTDPVDGETSESSVETVLDIGTRKQGWYLKCEKGGIRRVLTNLLGNSIKFTEDGFIHVSLREIPSEPDSHVVLLQLSVADSGKGIKKDFLKHQIFQPFSQENPLQTGTGLGLAIVNSIVRSEGMNGKVDIWSDEGVGTEIKVTIETEIPLSSRATSSRERRAASITQSQFTDVTVCLLGFNEQHRGQTLLLSVLRTYLYDWWRVSIVEAENRAQSNVLIINEDISILADLLRRQDINRTVVLLTSSRRSIENAAISSFEAMGGIISVLFKPLRPSLLFEALKQCSAASTPSASDSGILYHSSSTIGGVSPGFPHATSTDAATRASPSIARPALLRRHSSEDSSSSSSRRPVLLRRATSPYSNFSAYSDAPKQTNNWSLPSDSRGTKSPVYIPPTIPISDGAGEILLPSHGALRGDRKRVLVVEDNQINRTLLVQWLNKKGFEYEEAADGQTAVDIFNERPPHHFDVILIDMSMPVLDGPGAIEKIRQIERRRSISTHPLPHDENPAGTAPLAFSSSRIQIFALSGLASKADQVRAFNSGVDGYLVKPVSFKTLSSLFSRLYGLKHEGYFVQS